MYFMLLLKMIIITKFIYIIYVIYFNESVYTMKNSYCMAHNGNFIKINFRQSTNLHMNFSLSLYNFPLFYYQKYLEDYLNGLLENVFCRNDQSMVIPSKQRYTDTCKVDAMWHDGIFSSTFFSWNSSPLVLSPSSLILDPKACKQTSLECVRHKKKWGK